MVNAGVKKQGLIKDNKGNNRKEFTLFDKLDRMNKNIGIKTDNIMIFGKIKFHFWIIAFFVTIILQNACKDAYDFNMDKLSTDMEVNPVIAVPLIDASMTLEELLPDNEDLNRYLIIDENKFMTLTFENDFATYDIIDFMNGAPLSGQSLPPITYQIDPQVIELGLNSLLSEGSIHLANPTLKLIIKNYWDIPARFKFTDFFYYEEENSVALPLTGTLLDNWIDLDTPVSPDEFVMQEIVLDTNTTNIDEMLSAMPHHLSFGADFETIPGTPYDLTGVSPNEVTVEISIPLELSLLNIQLTDTIDFKLGENLDTTIVKSFKLNFQSNNGFPLGMNAQIYFVDENYLVLDSLFTNRLLIDPAKVVGGEVTEKTSTKSTVEVNIDRLDNIFKAKYIIPQIVFNTTNAANNEDVKLYSNHNIELQMGALIELHADIESNNSN